MSFWSWLGNLFSNPPIVHIPPPPPRRYTIGIHAFSDADLADDHRLAGATAVWDGVEPGQLALDDFGRGWLPPLPRQGFNITVSKDRYSIGWKGVELTSDQDLTFVLTALAPPPPPPASQGRVYGNHHAFAVEVR